MLCSKGPFYSVVMMIPHVKGGMHKDGANEAMQPRCRERVRVFSKAGHNM